MSALTHVYQWMPKLVSPLRYIFWDAFWAPGESREGKGKGKGKSKSGGEKGVGKTSVEKDVDECKGQGKDEGYGGGGGTGGRVRGLHAPGCVIPFKGWQVTTRWVDLEDGKDNGLAGEDPVVSMREVVSGTFSYTVVAMRPEQPETTSDTRHEEGAAGSVRGGNADGGGNGGDGGDSGIGSGGDRSGGGGGLAVDPNAKPKALRGLDAVLRKMLPVLVPADKKAVRKRGAALGNVFVRCVYPGDAAAQEACAHLQREMAV